METVGRPPGSGGSSEYAHFLVETVSALTKLVLRSGNDGSSDETSNSIKNGGQPPENSDGPPKSPPAL